MDKKEAIRELMDKAEAVENSTTYDDEGVEYLHCEVANLARAIKEFALALAAQEAECGALRAFISDFAEHKFDEFVPADGYLHPADRAESTTPFDVVEAWQEDARDVLTTSVQTCRKCGGTMKPGKATRQTLVGGMPDFPGDKHATTLSAGGPGKLIDCMKCERCGWSVTWKS